MDILNFLVEPLTLPFMLRAFVVTVLAAAVCALLSCWLVLLGWSLMGDAISHAVLDVYKRQFLESNMTPLPRPLKALGVAGIAASLMLGLLPAHAEGNNLYRNPSKFYTGAVSDCLLDKQYGRGQIADIWAYCNGLISTGVYEIPNSSASRMDVIAALYRLAGYPEVKNLPEVSPYADVETYDPTYPLAIWASREGITSGWSDGKFHPLSLIHI